MAHKPLALMFVILLLPNIPLISSQTLEEQGCPLSLGPFVVYNDFYFLLKRGSQILDEKKMYDGSANSYSRYSDGGIINFKALPGDVIEVKAINAKTDHLIGQIPSWSDGCVAGFGKRKAVGDGWEQVEITADPTGTLLPQPINLPNTPWGIEFDKNGVKFIGRKIVGEFIKKSGSSEKPGEETYEWRSESGCGVPFGYPEKNVEFYKPTFR